MEVSPRKALEPFGYRQKLGVFFPSPLQVYLSDQLPLGSMGIAWIFVSEGLGFYTSCLAGTLGKFSDTEPWFPFL